MNILKKYNLFFLIIFLVQFQGMFGQNGVSPVDGAIVIDSTVFFEWDLVGDVVDYDIEVAIDSNFVSIVNSQGGITSTNKIFTLTLGCRVYFWRVTANLNGGGAQTSKVNSFTYYKPSSTAGISLWLAPDSMREVGVTVDRWFDKSNNEFHANQNDSLKRPIKLSSSIEINNYPSLQFDGANDFMSIGDSLDLDSNDISIFVVGKANTNPCVFVSKSESGDNDGTYSIRYQGGATSNIEFRYGDGVNRPIVKNHPLGTYDIMTALTDRAIGLNKFYANGVQLGSISGINDSTYILNSPHPFRLGASAFSNGNTFSHLNGEMVEVIIYFESLSDSARYLVEQYLRYKYAPPINLGPTINIPYGFCDTTVTIQNYYDTFLWDNGDTINNITINKSGKYYASVIDVFGYSSSDTIEVIYPVTIDNFVADTTLCLGDSLTLVSSLNKFGYSFLWSDSSTDSIFTIKSPGSYWLRAIDSLGCFKYSDTITVAVDSFPIQTTLGFDKTVCQYGNLSLEGNNGGVSYLWSTTDTTLQTVVDTAGSYWVEVVNDIGCVAKDTIQIAINGIAPTVNFNIQDACDNLVSTFINTSFTTDGSNMVAWYWDFGNGDTSIVQSPQNGYVVPGDYDVSLQVETDSGCVNTFQQQVTIHAKPTAGFFPSNSLMCSSQQSIFSNNSFSSDGVVNSWSWDFGDVGIADTSTLENGTYTFLSSGSFNVQLISFTEYGCSDTTNQFVSVKQSPEASYVLNDSCANNLVDFSNTSIGNLVSTDWDFGDSNFSTLSSPDHVYDTLGEYNTQLVVKDLNGCYDTLNKPISIYDTPIAKFISDDYCVLSSSQLFDSSSTNSGVVNQWNWEVITTTNTSTSQHPNFLFSAADTGNYSVKLIVENSFGCIDSTINTIEIHPLPVPDFNFSPEIGLPPLLVNFTNTSIGGATYDWDFGDGGVSSDTFPMYTYLDTNIYNIKLITTSTYGCIDSLVKSIQVIEPIVDVAVENIMYEFISGSNFMKVTAQIANKGVVAVQNLDLKLSNSSTGNIIEKWVGNLLPNGQELIEFSSTIEMPRGEVPDVMCVEALNPNNVTDANTLDNEFCKSLVKFELVNLYPNPTSSELNMEFIIPESGSVEITLFNDIGKKVDVLFHQQVKKGLSRQKFILSVYSNGIYFLELKFNGETIRKKVMVN